MIRLPDWEARLHDYLADAGDRPFAFGSHDCALHGAAVVLAVTGEDHGAPFRGRYTTARGSVRALRKWGAWTVEATFDAHLPATAPAFARRGDLVLSEGMVGVCIGADALFVGREGERDGLVRIGRAAWTKAWSVG